MVKFMFPIKVKVKDTILAITGQFCEVLEPYSHTLLKKLVESQTVLLSLFHVILVAIFSLIN